MPPIYHLILWDQFTKPKKKKKKKKETKAYYHHTCFLHRDQNKCFCNATKPLGELLHF